MSRNRVAELFFRTPWAIKEELMAPMTDIVLRHVRGENLTLEQIEAATRRDNKPVTPDYEVQNGVARIPIYGVIAKRASMVNNISQAQGASVEEIRKNIEAALQDDSVKSIALDIDSPGGSVSGIHELSSFIFESRKKKTIHAYANGQMDSAAYYIGSAAEKIFATPSSEVGSIGVYSTIVDWSVANHQMGAKVHVIRAGSEKAVGHPDRPFTEEDRTLVQEEVNAFYDLFVESVARNRGISMDAAKKVATGRVWVGKKALEVGLVDALGSLDSNFSGQRGAVSAASAASPLVEAGEGRELAEAQTQSQQTEESEVMADLKTLTIDEMRAARPDLAAMLIKEGKDAGVSEAKVTAEAAAQSAAQADKERVKAIFGKAAEIKGVPLVAVEHAVMNGLSVEAATDKMKAAKLDAVQADHAEPMGAGNADPEMVEKRANDHLERAKQHQAKHGGSMTDALTATAEKKNGKK